MTLRNRHDRTFDHEETLDVSDVDVDEIRLPDFPARTPLVDVLEALVSRLGSTTSVATRSFTISAVIKRTVYWPYNTNSSFSIEAVIGTGSSATDVIPGQFTISAVKRNIRTGSFTINARVA